MNQTKLNFLTGMKYLFFIFLFVLSGTNVVHAADVSIKNAGFAPAGVWYSKESFFAGETVRIYTVIFNGSTQSLSGEVEFMDGSVVLGKTSFATLGSGKVRDVSIEWKATEGKHAISARIVNANLISASGQKTPITLENVETVKSEQVVELDPVAKAAQQKLQADRIATAGTGVVQKIEGGLQSVENSIPESVKSAAAAGTNLIEDLRSAGAEQFRVAKEEKGKQIDALNATSSAKSGKTGKNAGVMATTTSATEKPLAYVMYAILALLQYFFAWKIVFYSVSFYVIYRLLKWGIGKIRDRASAPKAP